MRVFLFPGNIIIKLRCVVGRFEKFFHFPFSLSKVETLRFSFPSPISFFISFYFISFFFLFTSCE